MAEAASVVLLFGLLGVGGALVLYVLVRREAENADRMSRDEAHERVSRDQDERR